jgi:hypothetical protein
MSKIEIIPCSCDSIDEQTATNLKVSIDPTARPNGTRLFEGPDMFVKGFLVQVQSGQSTKAYLGYGDARDTNACFEIAIGGDRFIGISESLEQLIAIPRPRFKPYNWFVNSTAAMTVDVILFL